MTVIRSAAPAGDGSSAGNSEPWCVGSAIWIRAEANLAIGIGVPSGARDQLLCHERRWIMDQHDADNPSFFRADEQAPARIPF
jgi:hypothetical protein